MYDTLTAQTDTEVPLNLIKKIFFALLILGLILILGSQLVIIYRDYSFIKDANRIPAEKPQTAGER